MKLPGLRVLMCHNRYRLTGGEDLSASAEAALLKEAGAHVEKYELSNDTIPDHPGIGTGLRTIWSTEAFRHVRNRLRDGKHQVLHVQNFFPQLSPSIFHAAHAVGVPVVAALRNYRLACLNGLLFREGRVCVDCVGRLPLPGVRHRCYRGSVAASSAVAAMLMVHRGMGTWRRMVDVFVAPSAFAARQLEEAGVPGRRLVVKPNFVHPDPGPGPGDGGFVLYAGRLSAEKGIITLLEAWNKFDIQPPLWIAGDGPLAGQVEEAAASIAGIEYMGPCTPEEVQMLMRHAALLVVPSEWYETFGRVVAEAFAVGTPVVAAAIGPLAEMVEPGRTGMLVPPGNRGALAAAISDLWSRPRALAAMRGEVRRSYEARYTGDGNLRHLERIYELAMRNRYA